MNPMNNPGPMPHGGTRKKRGAALIIILAFIVLLTGLVLAFFSRAITERQVSNSSAAQTKADILARSAADVIVGDFKQEIVNGSTATVVGSGAGKSTIYTPTAAANMLPQQSGTPAPAATPIPNFVRRSVRSDSLNGNPGVGSRASAVNSATDPSLNGRSMSLPRWNSHYLIPRLNSGSTLIDSTPVSSFTAPDWVMVTTTGPKLLTTPDPTTIGRYAYAVYDEGGLLDVNVAGYPSTSTAAQYGYKSSIAYADLKLLLTTGGTSTINSDNIVGWRNYATTQPSGTLAGNYNFDASAATRYFNCLLGSTSGFLTANPVPSPSPATAASRTDQLFTSRQALLKFRRAVSMSQDALQYLGTFSRDLNQPSLSPDPARPKIVSGDGGNDAYGGDDAINPSFLTVRVQTTKTGGRNDASDLTQGEPLVKKRFALNRLAWLTYKGPSAARNQADPDIQALINGGVNWNWLQLGTSANIQAYFGLTWDPANSQWAYSIQNGGSGAIKTLSQVAAANREPDFVELLKAAIHVGSIAKGASSHGDISSPAMPAIAGALSWEDFQFRRDISTDHAIMQIAANIIDQYDCDGYPVSIKFDSGAGPVVFHGVENLPYFYRTRTGVVLLRAPNPYPVNVTSADPLPPQDNDGLSAGPTVDGLPAGTSLKLIDADMGTGLTATFLQPEIWNPHDRNSSRGSPRPGDSGGTDLRLVADSSLPDFSSYLSIGQTGATQTSPGAPFSAAIHTSADSEVDTSIPFPNNYQPKFITLDSSKTALRFSDNSGALFREPTMLIKPGLPSGSQLAIDNTNQLVTEFSAEPLLQSYLVTSNGSSCVKSLQDNEYYFGIYLGVAPTRWVAANGAKKYVLSAKTCAGAYLPSGDFPVTYRLQYKDLNGNWQSYDQKVTDILGGGNLFHWSSQNNDTELIGQTGYATSIDPRSSRFGMASGSYPGILQFPPFTSSGHVAHQNASEFLDATGTVLASNRPEVYAGAGLGPASSYTARKGMPPLMGLPAAAGWYPGNWNTVLSPSSASYFFRFGLLSQNDSNGFNDGIVETGSAAKSTASPAPPNQYYADPDGVVRRAMAAYVPATSTSLSADTVVGLPMAIATSFTPLNPTGTPTTQSKSRPIILNRPFRSVADLGYVFSGTPWKNLDMVTPESGYTGLLDVFCIRDLTGPDGLQAGRVNLNTRQIPVLKAILAGAYKDEFGAAASNISRTEAETVAATLVNRTTSTVAGKGPLINISELVGKWTGNVNASGGGFDGSQSYSGFSADLSAVYGAGGSNADPAVNNIQRLRGSSIRALANTGTTRVWNLMIDLVAQTGRFPANASSPDKFIVEGEQRYWLHVAIDRQTGKILDKQTEVVKE